MAEAESPTTNEQQACIRERALVSVVANTAIIPFWLIPFTVLVSALTRDENDLGRLRWWIGAAALATALILVGLTAFRHRTRNAAERPNDARTHHGIVILLRLGLGAMGVVFGMSTWVASAAPVEMVMLFAVFPTTASAMAAMLTVGRRDMFASLLVPMAGLSAITLSISPDIRLRSMALLWVFYSAALTVVHTTLSRTARTAILLQNEIRPS